MKGIYFNGRRVLRPQAISKIDDTGMYGRGLEGGNTLALIGDNPFYELVILFKNFFKKDICWTSERNEKANQEDFKRE